MGDWDWEDARRVVSGEERYVCAWIIDESSWWRLDTGGSINGGCSFPASKERLGWIFSLSLPMCCTAAGLITCDF